jgi:hypothetical protein
MEATRPRMLVRSARQIDSVDAPGRSVTDSALRRPASWKQIVSWFAVSLVIAAWAAATSPSAGATPPGLNGELAYQSLLGAEPNIFTIQPFTGPLVAQTPLTRGGAADRDAAWSPDGEQIAFTSERNSNTDVYVKNIDSSALMRLTTNSADDTHPTWSRDGERIAFTSTRDEGNSEIYVMNNDGSQQTRLTTSAAIDRRPDWSPTGTHIAFESNRNGAFDIYEVDTESGIQTRLTFHPADDLDASWRPDGKSLAFASGDAPKAAIFSVSTDETGRRRHPRGRRQLTSNFENAHSPSWSPDGRQIAFTRGSFTYEKKVEPPAAMAELVASGVDAAWGPLPTPGGVPDLGETVNITPDERIRVRVPGAALEPLVTAREIPAGSVIDTRPGPAELEIATAKERPTLSVTLSDGRARVLQGDGPTPKIVLRLPRLDCEGEASPDSNRLRIRPPEASASRAERTSRARKQPVAKAAHRWPGHPGHEHAAPGPRPPQAALDHAHVIGTRQDAAARGTDWMMVDTCQSTETRVRTGTAWVKDAVTGAIHYVRAGDPPYVTPAP